MDTFIGKFISISCKNGLGVYQGQIVQVDANQVTLHKAFCDGKPCDNPFVVIESENIASLDLLRITPPPSITTGSRNAAVKVERPVAVRADAHQSPQKQKILKAVSPPPRKQETPRRVLAFESRPSETVETRQSPRRIDISAVTRRDRVRQKKDKEAFGSPVDYALYADFDFEKNLALFDKKAVYDEINASKPDLLRHSDKRPSNYRCNENVLESETTRFRQIQISGPLKMEYQTDTGLLLPCITQELRAQIALRAHNSGLTYVRQADFLARGAVEIALHLLGGAHRLNPHNLHQCPSVAVLCGVRRAGTQSANCARLLASHGVNVTLFAVDSTDTDLSTELSLARSSGCKITSNVRDLVSLTADLIIVGLADAEQVNGAPSSNATRWAESQRAPVLALDPPPLGTAGLTAKCSVVPILPFCHDPSNGHIYLANVGIPRSVYKAVGVEYVPPFGPKFVISLYPKDGPLKTKSTSCQSLLCSGRKN